MSERDQFGDWCGGPFLPAERTTRVFVDPATIEDRNPLPPPGEGANNQVGTFRSDPVADPFQPEPGTNETPRHGIWSQADFEQALGRSAIPRAADVETTVTLHVPGLLSTSRVAARWHGRQLTVQFELADEFELPDEADAMGRELTFWVWKQ